MLLCIKRLHMAKSLLESGVKTPSLNNIYKTHDVLKYCTVNILHRNNGIGKRKKKLSEGNAVAKTQVVTSSAQLSKMGPQQITKPPVPTDCR